MEKKRILIYTNHFYPENFKVNDIAFDFANKGYEVKVITGLPNYPHGKLFEGYGIFKKNKEFVNNVEVIRLPLITRGSGKALRLALNYLSYFISTIIYTLRLSFSPKYDLVFVHETSPIFICLSAVLYKKIKKVPLVVWVLDLWPESVFSAGNFENKTLAKVLTFLVKIIYKQSDVILTSSKGFEASILKKGNFHNKIIYFPNWAEDVFLNYDTENIHNIKLPEGFKIMYTGNLGEAQNFEIILDAAIKLKDKKNIKWILVGSGRKLDFIETTIKNHHLEETVYLLGSYPLTSMPFFFNESDVMLVSLKDEAIFNITVPAKLQAYMAYGKPIIGLLKGEGATIIEEAKCGYVCSQSDSNELVDLITKLEKLEETELENFSNNAKNYYLQNFSKTKNLNFLETLFLKLV